MLEMIRNILILTGVLLIVFFTAQYLRSRTDYRFGLFYKIGSLLMYGCVKVCSAIGYGLEYINRKVVSVLCDYHANDERLASVRRNEGHPAQNSDPVASFKMSYGHNGYRLKILK